MAALSRPSTAVASSVISLLFLVLCTAATLTQADDAIVVVPGKKSPFDDRSMYYLTTCKGVAMAFVGYDAGKTGDRNLTVVKDSTSTCKLRVMAPFETADGVAIDAAEGFDPCEYTTCDGVKCLSDGYVLTQEYYNVSEYVSDGRNLTFPNYQSAASSGPRCVCRNPKDKMEEESNGHGTINHISVDPAGPSAEKNDAVCTGLACGDDASAALTYYLHSDDTTLTGCQCCKKQPALLSPSSTSDPTCGVVTPQIKADSGLREDDILNHTDGVSSVSGFSRYFTTRCKSRNLNITFSTFVSTHADYSSFGAVADPNADGGLRIMAAFKTNGGEDISAKDGFDPCKYTTCDGVKCDTDGYILSQEYYSFYSYISSADPLTFPDYQKPGDFIESRCTCRNPETQMTRQLLPTNVYYDNLTVDPAGPSAEQSDAACKGLTCDTKDSVALTYYLLSDDQTLTGCHCCKKQSKQLAPSSSSKPTCGVAVPKVRADSGLRDDDILNHTDGESDGNGFSRYFTTRCKSKNADITFSTFVASYGGYASFGAVADPKADGGLRIMAPFKTNSGESFTVEQGFDPCKYTTCDGVTCDTDGYVLTQEYYSLYDYTSSSNALTFPDYQKSGDFSESRCTCRNPKARMTRELRTPTTYYDNLTVDPAGPSAEQSDAACKGLTCDTKVSGDLTYYLLSDDQTLTGCQCCKKQSKRVAPSEYASAFADCGAMRPTILSDSGLKPGALLDYFAGAKSSSGQKRYFLATCKSTGEQIAFSTYAFSYRAETSFGAVADPNADGGLRIMAPFKTNGGEDIPAKDGFDPCKYTTCGGVRCNTPGFALTQEYYDVGSYVNLNFSLSFPPYHATADSDGPRCTCRNTTDFMNREAGDGSFFDNLTVLPDGPSAQISDAVCYDYACSTTHAEDVLYYLAFTRESKTGCQCCLKDPTVLSEPSSDYTPQCNISQVINKPTTTTAPSTSPSPSSSSSPSADPAPAAWHLPYLQSLSHACPTSELRGVEYGSLVADSGEMCCTFRDVAGAVSAPQCGAQMLQLARGPGTLSCSGTVGNRPVSCCGAVDRLGKVRGNGRVCRGH